jgi:hypothetical protein
MPSPRRPVTLSCSGCTRSDQSRSYCSSEKSLGLSPLKNPDLVLGACMGQSVGALISRPV